MKTKRFFAAILSMALCVNFVSCGDDDDDAIDSGNGPKRLVSFTESEGGHYTLSYDNEGRVSKMVYEAYGDSHVYYFSFSGNEVVVTCEDPDETDTLKLYLNESGYCTSQIWKHIDLYEESTAYTKFTYNSDGQLIESDYEEGDHKEHHEFVYEDGVLLSGPLREFTYTDIPNIGNLFIRCPYTDIGVVYNRVEGETYMWLLTGLYGKSSKFLPEAVKDYLSAADRSVYNLWTFDYELDKAGYVKTVSARFIDAGGKESYYTDYYKNTYESIK